MAKPLPMPVQMVAQHPAVIALPNGAYNAVLALSVAYWMSECRPMPTAARDLMCIGRFDLRTYTKYQVGIHQCLKLVYSLLESAMSEERAKLAERIAKARTGAIASNRAQSAARAILSAPHADKVQPHTAPTEPLQAPSRARRYEGTGKSDQAVRRAATSRHQAVQRLGGMALTDAGVGELLGHSSSATDLKPPSADPGSPWRWEPTAEPVSLPESVE